MDGRTKLGPIWRAWIGLTVAALVTAAVPAVASAQSGGPQVTKQPSLTGSAWVGSQLNAGGATWTGRPTIDVDWAWLRCSTDSLWSCELIGGAQAASYIVTSADLGKRLRALLVLSNRDGRAYGWTAATSAVTTAPPPTPAPPPPPPPPPLPSPPPAVPAPQAVTPVPAVAKMMRPAPLVRIRGWLTRRGAHISLLTVRAPRGARVSVSCSGRGCPRTAPAQAAKLTRLRAYEGHLLAGARLVVRVTRPGFVGKHTLIRIRRGKQPVRRDRCLYPGTEGPTKCQS